MLAEEQGPDFWCAFEDGEVVVIGDEPANTINDRRRRRLLCRGAKESLLTVPKPRAISLLSVYLAVKPVGEPDAGDRHVRFDERGWETERCRMAQATAPILDFTAAGHRHFPRNKAKNPNFEVSSPPGAE